MKIVLFLLFNMLVVSSMCKAQNAEEFIYNKEIVYKYKVTHIDANKKTHKNDIYLVCNGVPWRFDSLRQVEINWAYSFEEIFKPTYGTGAADNEERIWLHPPRQDKFSILEYSPFPYMKLPVSMNSQWNWELALGKYWANKKLGVKADDMMKYEYALVSQVEMKMKFLSKSIKCFKIEAHSINPKFKSSLVSYFNPKYGFVKLKYTNIDNSTMQFELIDNPTMTELRFLNTYIAE